MEKKRDKPLLVAVAKAPVPGTVKTRLIPPFTCEEAAELYRCFLGDRLKTMNSLKGIDLAIAYTPEGEREMFVPLSRNGIALFSQKGRNLGERLKNIFIEKFSEGYGAVSIVDSDTPDLPRETIQETFRRLKANLTDVVFGPCHDGGYYLVGMRKLHPELFDDIPWSTDAVLSTTLKKAEEQGVKTDLLSALNDLDTFEDLVVYYNQYKNRGLKEPWAGKKTFEYLAGQKKIRQGIGG